VQSENADFYFKIAGEAITNIINQKKNYMDK